MENQIDEEIHTYVLSAAARSSLEDAIAAYLLVHTKCLLGVEVAFERARAMYEYATAEASRIMVADSGDPKRATVTLVSGASGHRIRLNFLRQPTEGGAYPIRLMHGTKCERTKAWETVHAQRRALVQEETKKLREEARAAREAAATMKR